MDIIILSSMIIFLMGVASGCFGGEIILLLFIGVMAAGCWSELRGGYFWGGS